MDYLHEFSITDSGEYYINLFINSTHSKLVSYTIKQNDSIIMNIQQECFYTASKNDPFLKQYVDVKQSFHLDKGEYSLHIESSSNFTIYEVNIMKFRANFFHLPDFEPDNTMIPHVSRPYNKYLIIPNIHANKGGLCWCIRTVLVGIKLAIDNDLIPIVHVKGGMYYSNSIYDPPDLPDSWWNYFFYDPVPIHPDEKKRVLEHPNKRFMRFRRIRQNMVLIPNNENCSYLYTNEMFSKHQLGFIDSLYEIAKKYLKPLPYMDSFCNNFINSHVSPDKKLLGVHYRGTDKYPTATRSDDTHHYPYEKVLDMIKQKMGSNTIIFVASDEETFVQYMAKHIGAVHIDTLRSEANTGGVQYPEFMSVRFGKCSDPVIQQLYDNNKSSSIHFGMKDKQISLFMKGIGCVRDLVILSKCYDHILSEGNMSEMISYLTSEPILNKED